MLLFCLRGNRPETPKASQTARCWGDAGFCWRAAWFLTKLLPGGQKSAKKSMTPYYQNAKVPFPITTAARSHTPQLYILTASY